MILVSKPMALNSMNNSGLWMKLVLLGHLIGVLDAVNNSGLWLT